MRGIANLGNTCGIGTLIQCLFHVEPFRNTLMQLQCPRNTLTGQLQQIFHDLHQTNNQELMPIVPKTFLKIFYEQLQMFEEGEQHDICELWMFLIEKLCTETHSNTLYESWNTLRNVDSDASVRTMQIHARLSLLKHNKTSASELLHIIQGHFVSQVECKVCGHLYHNFEPYTFLPAHIDANSYTLIECLQHIFREEQLFEWKCDKCKNQNGVRTSRIWNLPSILCIHLKRYENSNGAWRKQKQLIDVPYTMTFPDTMTLDPSNLERTYVLRSIALHHGSIHGGHYTSICAVNNTYMHFDDINVQKIQGIESVLPIIQKNAYMLIYELQ